MAFKDLFIKGDEQLVKVQNPVAAQNPSSQSSAVKITIPARITVTNADENEVSHQSGHQSDDRIIDTIWSKIIGENRPGPDYLELKNNVDALSDLPVSDEQKITSAFKVLQKSYPNFRKDDIIKAIDFYINVVNNEKSSGLEELNSIKANTVDRVEEEIKSMQAQAADFKRQYDDLQNKIGAKTTELTQAKVDLANKNNVFLGSIDAVMDVLESDKNRIMSINF